MCQKESHCCEWSLKGNARQNSTGKTANSATAYLLSSTCTEVSGVENMGQCGRLSQLSWLLGTL